MTNWLLALRTLQKSLVLKTVGLKRMSDFIRSSDSRDHEKCTRNVVEGFFGFGDFFLCRETKEGNNTGK